MDLLAGLNRAMDFIEEHIGDELDLEAVAWVTTYSARHFGRVFCYLADITLSEYIRRRKMTLAAFELQGGDARVIDLAVKYGYESADSFTRAFTKLHGVTPTEARVMGATLKVYPKLSFHITIKGENEMDYRIEEKGGFELVGYKREFTGEVGERFEQLQDFWVGTRDEQAVLEAMRDTAENIWYDVSGNRREDGFDHYICVTTSEDAPDGFCKVAIPKQLYVVTRTAAAKYPTTLAPDLRGRIAEEWLATSDYALADGFEVSVVHWYPLGTDKKYIELWVPIQRR
ncbi:MAG: AraC family transcriptional regulator [Oscillospiraceae bacterium]|jgi:AraC family transcriptional regulator|nr:AraC family transcriptional regulator [Oscillospiraceae bacterium]